MNLPEYTLNKYENPIEIQPGLDILVANFQQDNIAALVSKGEFEQNIVKAESTGKYDYVLVDTPPVSLTSETVLMSSVISNLLFVVRSGKSQRDTVRNSLEQLKQNGAYPLGLLVNDVKAISKAYYKRSNYLSASVENADKNF